LEGGHGGPGTRLFEHLGFDAEHEIHLALGDLNAADEKLSSKPELQNGYGVGFVLVLIPVLFWPTTRRCTAVISPEERLSSRKLEHDLFLMLVAQSPNRPFFPQSSRLAANLASTK
jgi:hypothetical protein